MKKLLLFILTITTTTVFAQLTKIHEFTYSNGQEPFGSLLSEGNSLYGMTSKGGKNGWGTIFKIQTDGTGFTKLFDFDRIASGSGPVGSLVSDKTYLYGMTYGGGTNNMGTIFRIKIDGSGFTKLFEFAGASNGKFPVGSLLYDGTFLYGMTQMGGTNDKGVIFKVKPDGSEFNKLLDFSGKVNGASPQGSLISDGTFLYGMTNNGGNGTGTNGNGTIFKIKPDGSQYTKLYDFMGIKDGEFPYGSLVSDGSFLYGTTALGGKNSMGTIFKIKPDGTQYAILLDFANTNGKEPFGSLISVGTALYGMSQLGGSNNFGVLFKIQTDGTSYTKLGDFTGTLNGKNPYGSLITDGTNLYGMTQFGGTDFNYSGTIFKYGLSVTGIGNISASNKTAISVFPNPCKNSINLQSEEKYSTYTINDLSGKLVNRGTINNSRIDLNSIKSGIYILTATQKEGEKSSIKIIKE
jgi:uncharacterized repeat protein (TIGR03803 family)